MLKSAMSVKWCQAVQFPVVCLRIFAARSWCRVGQSYVSWRLFKHLVVEKTISRMTAFRRTPLRLNVWSQELLRASLFFPIWWIIITSWPDIWADPVLYHQFAPATCNSSVKPQMVGLQAYCNICLSSTLLTNVFYRIAVLCYILTLSKPVPHTIVV